MRILSIIPASALRALFAASLVVAAGCGGGSSSSGNSPIPNPGSSQLCDSNSSGIQLARPGQYASGVSTSTNSIEIVDNGNTDQLATSYGQFDLNLVDNFGQTLVTGFFSPAADPNGPHPFSTDFYYSAPLQGVLQPGRTYNVYLNAPNTNCTPGLIGSFST